MYSEPCAHGYLVFISSPSFMWVFFFLHIIFLFPLQTSMKFALQLQYQRDCAFTLLFSISFLIKKPNPRVLQSMNFSFKLRFETRLALSPYSAAVVCVNHFKGQHHSLSLRRL